MKQLKLIFVLTIITFVFAGCYTAAGILQVPPNYIPTVAEAPTLKKAQDIQFSGYYGNSGFDTHLSYAASSHFGIMLNTSYLNIQSTTTIDAHKHKFGEIGIGYYTQFGKHWLFSTFAGLGNGSIFMNQLFLGDTLINVTKYSRIFVQPTISLTYKHLDINFSTRLSKTDIILIDYTTYSTFFFVPALGNFQRNFISPIITLRAGTEHIRLITQIGASFPMNLSKHTEYSPVMLSIGLQFNFNAHKFREKEKEH